MVQHSKSFQPGFSVSHPGTYAHSEYHWMSKFICLCALLLGLDWGCSAQPVLDAHQLQRGVTGAARSCSSLSLRHAIGKLKILATVTREWAAERQESGFLMSKSPYTCRKDQWYLSGTLSLSRAGLLGQCCCPRRTPQYWGSHEHVWVPKHKRRYFCSPIWTRCSDFSGLGTGGAGSLVSLQGQTFTAPGSQSEFHP